VIAMTPVVSGFAVLSLYSSSTERVAIRTGSAGLTILVAASLFCAIMGREMVMDVLDCDADTNAGIKTVPVKYGRSIASKIILGFWVSAGVLTCIGPFVENWEIFVGRSGGSGTTSMYMSSAMRRLVFALVGGTWYVVRGLQICLSQGQNEALMTRSREEAKTILFTMLAASV